MKKSRKSRERATSFNLAVKVSALVLPVVLGTACGAMSNPARKDMPSRLMLEAQAEYDAGNYSKAVELLEKLVEKDPSNDEGLVRLTFAYSGSLGITPVEFVKNLATSTGSSSGSGSDITKLTGKSSLPDEKIQKLKTQSSTITTASQLRTLFPEFATFQKAFLTVCPLFSKSTIAALKTKASSALDILEVSKCGDGRDSANATISVAALFLALGQFSSLYKAVLDADGDGTIDIQKRATDAKASIDSLTTNDPASASANLTTLRTATQTLTSVGQTLKGDVFKLAVAQFSIIDAVITGTNLPADVKTSISKGIDGLNTALATINSYMDAGKTTTTATQTGTATTDAATKAKEKAQVLLASVDAQKQEAYCKDIYCFNIVYNTGQTPSQCSNFSFTAAQCTTTPTVPPQQ